MHIDTRCYCCPQRATTAEHTAMDLDSALNELGMLSSVTDSRRQYLQEKARRDSLEKSRGRNMSEPSLGSLVTATPTNSPSKSNAPSSQSSASFCHVLRLNPQYVVSLTSGSSNATASQQNHSQHSYFPSTSSYDLNAACYNTLPQNSNSTVVPPTAEPSIALQPFPLGRKYSQENMDYQVRGRRTLKLRLSRLKRFKKPYEIPWLSGRKSDPCPPPPRGPTLLMPSTAAAAPRSPRDPPLGNSNFSPPTTAKPAEGGGSVTRSKSLDELDFSKLQLAEAENHNFILERKEIESVSQNLQKLHVYE